VSGHDGAVEVSAGTLRREVAANNDRSVPLEAALDLEVAVDEQHALARSAGNVRVARGIGDVDDRKVRLTRAGRRVPSIVAPVHVVARVAPAAPRDRRTRRVA